MGYQRICAKIDLNAIEKNVAGVRVRIPADTKIMAVIKADAYGHGAAVLARFLDDKVDWFGVATADEAVELRVHGCGKPILILGYVHPEEYTMLVQQNITTAIFRYEDAKKLSDTALSEGTTAEIHIKIDTGMCRIGYPVSIESAKEIQKISRLPGIRITGMFSHFYSADAKDKTQALVQREKFDHMIAMLDSLGVEIPIKHLNNSAGTMELDKYYDMVRMGIMLYGIYPSDEMDLSYPLYPAMELVSHISHIKTIEAGDGVSYGHTYVADHPVRLATVPVGYADGYPRSLSNKGHVLIGGMHCPILGRVCMDQMMIDITGLDTVSIGDPVILLGGAGEHCITAAQLGDVAGSFSYELVSGIGMRVPRVYIYNGRQIEFVNRLQCRLNLHNH